MLKKLIVFAITSGLASKAYRALMNRQRTPAPVRGNNVANNAAARPGQPAPAPASGRRPSR